MLYRRAYSKKSRCQPNAITIRPFYLEDFVRAHECYSRSLHIRHETGNRWGKGVAPGNLWEASNTFSHLGYTCWALSDFARSEAYYAEKATEKVNFQCQDARQPRRKESLKIVYMLR